MAIVPTCWGVIKAAGPSRSSGRPPSSLPRWTCVPNSQERTAAPSRLASLQRTNPRQCDDLSAGVRPLEDAGPPAKRAGLETQIHKPDPHRAKAVPKPRRVTPKVILRESGQIAIGDIELETTDGQKLSLRRVARPMGEQRRISQALRLEIPERLSPDRTL
jgi:hypothetical protein